MKYRGFSDGDGKSLAIFYEIVYNEHYIILFRSLILFQMARFVPISHLIYMDRARERRKMDYTEFTRAVEKMMNQRLGDSERVSSYTAIKNNGTEKRGIMVEKKGVNISPAIYLEEYYECYQNGCSIEGIVDEVMGFYECIRRDESWDNRSLMSFEGIRDKVVFRLINTEKNLDFLRTVPHRDVFDLSAVFYVLLEMNSERTAAMTVKNSHMLQWKADVDMLWNAAVENAKKILPAELFTMSHALGELMRGLSENSGESENLLVGKGGKRDGMYVLSNQFRCYGAACVAYPHILNMIGQILKKDYYILPSSVHEVVIVPGSTEFDIDELDEMVKEINDTQVDEEDILSDHAYFVEYSTGKVYLNKGEEAESDIF